MDLSEMDDKQIEAEVSDRVYAAALVFETLESLGKVHGNGHHMAQKVADFAAKLYRERHQIEVSLDGDKRPF